MLEGRSYVPLVYLRQSEMQALEEIPTPTKNLVVPLIRVRPWLGSKSLVRSGERIQKAIGNRLFGFDLDAAKRGHGSGDTKAEYSNLFEEADGWKCYDEHIEQFPGAVPVLRSKTVEMIDEELDRVQAADRGLFLRIEVGGHQQLSPLVSKIAERQIENVVYVLDCGWHAKLLPYQAQCVGLLKTLISLVPGGEFVVAGGDFPQDGFDKSGAHFVIEGEERALVNAVRREINEAEIIFGDWASARPPRVDSEIRRNRPRVDMPTRTGWECWRRPTPGPSYQEICSSAASSRALGESSDLWGHQMIIGTASGKGTTQIRSPNVAAAVRINLHMILQAHYDSGPGPSLGDEQVSGEL